MRPSSGHTLLILVSCSSPRRSCLKINSQQTIPKSSGWLDVGQNYKQHLTGKLHATEQVNYIDTFVLCQLTSPRLSLDFYLTRFLKNSWREFLFSSFRGMLGEASVLPTDLLSGAVCGAGAAGFGSSLAFTAGAASATGGGAGVSFLGSGALC